MTDETLPTFKTTQSSKTTKTETESSKMSEATETGGASTVDVDGSHLDTFIIPENDEAYVDPDAPQALDDDGEPIAPDYTPERLDKAAFYITFKIIFQVPAMLDKDFAPLTIQSDENDQARAASDATYDLLEIWYPAALEPNSDTIAHLLIVVPFLAGKVILLKNILEDKRKTIEHVPTPQSPAPEAKARGAI